MNWTKNLSKIRLPYSGRRGAVRYWQTLLDRANRDSDMSRNDDGPDYTEALRTCGYLLLSWPAWGG